MSKKFLFIAVIAILVLSFATSAFAGGVEGWPKEGKSYQMVNQSKAFPYASASYQSLFGGFYGMQTFWFDGDGTWYNSAVVAYKDKRNVMYWGMDMSQVSFKITKSGPKVPTVTFFSDGAGYPVRMVVKARIGTCLFAPELY